MSADTVPGSIERFGPQEGWRYAAVIPARNEAARIADCLSALAQSMSGARGRGAIVVVVNNTGDATRQLARQWWAARPHVSGLLLDCHIPARLACVGRARGLGLDLAAGMLAPDGVLMTSDADARVHPDWVAANLRELGRADLICGTVQPDAAELAGLPDAFMRHGAAEGRYMQALLKLIARLDPVPHEGTAHRNAAGASLAFRLPLYTDIGGMPCLPQHEDRVFAANAEARDWRIRYAQTPVVHASCRLTGRTGGGMAAALRARITDDDPPCDEFLEPAGSAILRYGLRGRLRQAWPDPERIARLLPGDGPFDADLPPWFGTFWRQVEAATPALSRRRLRQSDLAAEQKRLDHWFAADTLMEKQA
ncbi:glycosyltransferase family 2 protein [Paracoccus sp. MA]|uniref:glycosyltransferase n=1 Tax=Paracoccus sp. MA TaxID=2895796 RepID=UPI001E2CBAD8|nr:glycosyltransferase family A protein [Paracoccus sp. MA]UFM65956.1 glycosyltransferase family 2 protein [Paracoccus sp. MA]